MKRIIVAVGVIAVGTLLFAGKAGAMSVKEGAWAMTTVIHMDGMDDEMAEMEEEMANMSEEEKAMMHKMMGGMKIGPQGGGMGMSTTMTQCITNDNPVPKAKHKDNCKQTHSIKGNTVHFEEACPASHSTGQITYRNDSMSGTIHSTQTTNGKEENVTLDISGQYVGPCD